MCNCVHASEAQWVSIFAREHLNKNCAWCAMEKAANPKLLGFVSFDYLLDVLKERNKRLSMGIDEEPEDLELAKKLLLGI